MIAATKSLLCALSLVAGPTPSAPAESIGVLPLAPAPGPGPELVEITEKLRGELARKLEGVLTASELRSRMQGKGTAASLSELERAFDGAQEELKKDPARGIEWLRTIRADLLKQPDSAEVYELWIRVTLRLARARLEFATSAEDAAAGQAEARSLVEAVLRANPDAVVDPLEYSRRIERLAADVRASLAKAPKRKLTVKSSAADTLVYVNGREVGKAPVTVSLPAGEVRVSGLRGALHSPREKVVLSDQDQTISLDFSLIDLFRPDLGPGLAVAPAEEDRMVLRAAVWLGLERVVTTSLQREKDVQFLVTKVVDVKPHAAVARQGWVRLSQGSVPIGGYSDLSSFLLTNTYAGQVKPGAPSLEVDAKKVPPPPPKQEAPSPRAGATALGWSSVATTGLALVLAGVAIQQSSASSGYYDDANALLSNGTVLPGKAGEYNSLVDKGDKAKQNAIIFGVTAGVSAAAAIVTGVYNKKGTGQVWPFLF